MITVFKGDGMQKQGNDRNQLGEKWAARDDWRSRSGQRSIYIPLGEINQVMNIKGQYRFCHHLCFNTFL